MPLLVFKTAGKYVYRDFTLPRCSVSHAPSCTRDVSAGALSCKARTLSPLQLGAPPPAIWGGDGGIEFLSQHEYSGPSLMAILLSSTAML